MNDYFDQFELSMGEALEKGANAPWHSRLRRISRGRAIVVVFAALVVATPAVGAVSNWFSFGSPDHVQKPSATTLQGAVLPGTSTLLSLRVQDPQGGPAWGLRQIRTSRGDTCLQVGRVEQGTLGSLGIDGASDNDHLFHPFPSDYVGDVCGSSDAQGDGFVNVVNSGAVANAVPQASPSLATCQPSLMWPQIKGSHFPSLAKIPQPNGPACPTGSARIVASGLLGPDAKAITYEAPNGKLRTEPTAGHDGAYLLVLPLNQQTCTLYADGGPCGESSSESAASPASPGPVKSVLYKDGHVCKVNADSPCPAVGFVATNNKPVTPGQIATPITVRVYRADHWCELKHPGDNPLAWTPCNNAIPGGYRRINLGGVGRSSHPGVLLHITFKAPIAITTSSSWYSMTIQVPSTGPPRGRPEPALAGIGAGTDVSQGQTVRFQWFEPDTAHGIHHGVIAYTYYKGPTNATAGVSDTKPTSVIVARFSFRVP